MLTKTAGACVLLVFAASGAARAEDDDVVNSINEGMEFYQKGDYAEATTSLNYAVQLIQQKKGASLEALLPGPLDGWTAQPAESQSTGAAAMFGGDVSAERRYSKDAGQLLVRIVTDSPLLQSIMMMFSNPMFVTAGGGTMERIGKQKAVVKYDPASRSGDLQIVVNNRFLVTVEGNGVNRDDLLAYARAVDLNKLAAFP
jgi:hypothetical protein